MTRDLIREEFSELTVELDEINRVILSFPTQDEADRAYFVIKNALELGLPIQIRTR